MSENISDKEKIERLRATLYSIKTAADGYGDHEAPHIAVRLLRGAGSIASRALEATEGAERFDSARSHEGEVN